MKLAATSGVGATTSVTALHGAPHINKEQEAIMVHPLYHEWLI